MAVLGLAADALFALASARGLESLPLRRDLRAPHRARLGRRRASVRHAGESAFGEPVATVNLTVPDRARTLLRSSNSGGKAPVACSPRALPVAPRTVKRVLVALRCTRRRQSIVRRSWRPRATRRPLPTGAPYPSGSCGTVPSKRAA